MNEHLPSVQILLQLPLKTELDDIMLDWWLKYLQAGR